MSLEWLVGMPGPRIGVGLGSRGTMAPASDDVLAPWEPQLPQLDKYALGEAWAVRAAKRVRHDKVEVAVGGDPMQALGDIYGIPKHRELEHSVLADYTGEHLAEVAASGGADRLTAGGDAPLGPAGHSGLGRGDTPERAGRRIR